MFIDVQNSSIIIKDESGHLRSYQIAQLRNWGYIKISDNQYQLVNKEPGDYLIKTINYYRKENIQYELSESCKSILLKSEQNQADYEKAKNICRNYKNGILDTSAYSAFSAYLSKSIKRPLKDHQLKAAFHLYLAKNGANFSVPGSGKTTVVLSVYKKLKDEGKANLLFVVGPPACFAPWETEYETNLGHCPKYKILAGGNKEGRKQEYYCDSSNMSELYLTTFQTMQNDQDELIRFFNSNNISPFMVIDEGHYIKQLGGNWAKAALNIAKYAKYRCVLTGTPIPKSYTDIFNLFDYLWPDNNPIDASSKTRIQIDESINNIGEIKQILEDKIGPLFYRVRKMDLGLIKPIFHPPIILEMNHYERLLHDAIKRKIIDYEKDDYNKNIEIINRLKKGRIVRLRQSVSYPKLLSTAIDTYSEELIEEKSDLAQIICNYNKIETPAKIEYLLNFVKEMKHQKQKLVIWAYFRGTIHLIVEKLRKAGFYCKIIYGDTPTENDTCNDEETREKIRNEFVDSDSGLDILIANPAACAESISLHKTCFHALYYDLSYNCAQYLQSLDRIHRVGGSEYNEANYYFLQYRDSIDQDIKNNLDEKANKMYDVIEKDYGVYSLDMFEDDDDLKAYERLFDNRDV